MSIFQKGLFGGSSSSGGGGSGTGWDGRVDTFADLPSAAANNNKYYMVDQATGTVGVDYKSSGIYRSDGSAWTLRGTPPLTSVLIGGILVSAAALGVFGSSTIKVTPDAVNGTMTIEGNYTEGNGINITGNIVSINASLDDLTDVSTAGQTDGMVLGYNGSAWVPTTMGGGGGGGNMTYPSAGIAKSSGSGWLASITDNSANWNTAYTVSGIANTTATNALSIATIANTTANSKLSDAPADGSAYARKDGNWSVVTATENDTLATVTARGNTTTSGITLGSSTPSYARLNVIGTGVTATNFTSFSPTAQQLSQTAVIEGNGSAWYAWRDVASGNEGAVGASVNGAGFLATTTSTPLELRTANTARVTVTAAGNVGVGTTAPTTLLSVNGTVSATSAKLGTTSVVGQVWTASDAVGNGAWANATGGSGGSSQWTNTTGGIYYNAGNVAIGTTDTTSALNVAGTVNATTVTAGNLPKYYTATRSYTSNNTTVGTDMLDLSFDVVAGKRYYVAVTIGASVPNTAGGFGASFHANTTAPAVSNSSTGQWLWSYDAAGGWRVYTQSWQPWTTCINGIVPSAQAFTTTGRLLPQTFSGIFDAVLNATIYPTFKTCSTSYTTTTSDASTLSVTEIN